MKPMDMTTNLQEALANAQQIAQTRHHQEITIPHLFTALVQPSQFADRFYEGLSISTEAMRQELNQELDRIVCVEGSGIQYLSLIHISEPRRPY